MIKRNIRVQAFVIENSKFLLIKHYNKKEDKTFWGIPGGGQEENETLQEAIKREVNEETGLNIELLPFKSTRQSESRIFLL